MFHNPHVLWMCRCTSPDHLPAALICQALGGCPDFRLPPEGQTTA